MKYFFLSFLVPLLCWGQVHSGNEEEALFLNRIADFWEEGEYQIAKEQIHEFLNFYPKSQYYDTLSSALGDLFLRDKNYSSALVYYAKIKDEQILTRVFPRKIQCLYALQNYDDLTLACEEYLKNHEDIQISYYLATALYQQINANPTEALVKKALPLFETLFASHLKKEVSAAFAHLLCLAKDFPKAASIYLDLANDTSSEEMLFQAAIIQAEYDKELSLKTFSKLQKTTPESVYNSLVLSFDLQKYSEIIEAKESYLEALLPEQIPMAHLFFGRSFFCASKI